MKCPVMTLVEEISLVLHHIRQARHCRGAIEMFGDMSRTSESRPERA